MKLFKEKKLIIAIICTMIFMCLVSIVSNVILYKKYEKKVNIVFANVVGLIIQKYPDISDVEIIKLLNIDSSNVEKGKELLNKYGISEEESTILNLENKKDEAIIINSVILVDLTIIICILITINFKKKNKQLQEITKYIKQINQRNYELKIEENSESELSILKNELYKITVMLKEQADESIKRKKALQTSLEDISHQLRTPLTSILIMLDNIIENPEMDEETRKRFISEISRQIKWINWLVISLLKFSKLDSNTIQFNKQEINVKKLISEVIDNLTIPLDIKQQSVIINGNETVKFIGDPKWELEAIINIVKNCIEHTEENKKIIISFDENNFYTKICIQDEGIGIDKEDLKHVFERFYKGKNSSENSIGIGLALAKTIIEKDNGSIICSSKVGEGTIFEIRYMK